MVEAYSKCIQKTSQQGMLLCKSFLVEITFSHNKFSIFHYPTTEGMKRESDYDRTLCYITPLTLLFEKKKKKPKIIHMMSRISITYLIAAGIHEIVIMHKNLQSIN